MNLALILLLAILLTLQLLNQHMKSIDKFVLDTIY
jgi:hypothetical protein